GARDGRRSGSGTMVLWVLVTLFTGIAMGGACSTCIGAAASTMPGDTVMGGGDRVGVVELTGAITDASSVVRDIREHARRSDLRAIVVRIDSPGGAVAPSQEIFDALRAASKEKPVVASMGSVAASGGLWSALGADWIFAQPGSVTGSIGVITQTPDLTGIAEVLRFKMRTFKSGPLKDAGNPLREMTPDDELLFMSLIEDIYDQFVTVVAERRKLPVDKVKEIADGRIMTGRAALKAGLVDELGGLVEASRKAVILAKIRGEQKEGQTVTSTVVPEELEDPTLVYPKKPMPTLLELLTQGAQSAISKGLADGVERAAARAEETLTRSPKMELR
ncbi:signal peptide peptidase SppA, partial [Myxococcota bacterium]|nr:signal peptide peptidase SppA [Myxococcota bacterium]